MILTTLTGGGSADEREQAIAARLDLDQPTAVLLEGLPSGAPVLPSHPNLIVTRLASGCPCCSGNLVFRVTLNRILRGKPQQLHIGLASPAHLEALRDMLLSPPYATMLDVQTSA